ncbi:MAG: UDP-N-acetylmuramoyl-L-alanine--D-glutamate ligase [Candidatus Omnitrophica bacterium]|nr:UDP-N-acetylmuramoyl-L-alanine--D-glutamate ligase [Candidatus Omnitrophota bacterium]
MISKALKSRKVTVVGLGKSGWASALLLKEKGARVKVTDAASTDDVLSRADELRKMGIDVETGGHTHSFVHRQDLVVTSPGVPDGSLPLRVAAEEHIPVWSEIELGYRFCKVPIIAVTGTNGKSTVTTLIGEMLRESGIEPLVCGNIGKPFCSSLKEMSPVRNGAPRRDISNGIGGSTVVVLEVSSFQLEHIVSFRPRVSVILNISRNHLNRHKDFGAYVEAKSRILLNQKDGDWAVLNSTDALVRGFKTRCKSKKAFFSKSGRITSGAYFEKGELILKLDGKTNTICRADDMKIKGGHNIEDALAASIASYLAGAKIEGIRRALKDFPGLEHRCEYAGELNGIHFINDSKSTTPEATRWALELSQGPAVLIAGGRDKGSDFNSIKDIVSKKAKAMVLIGESAPVLKNIFSSVLPVYQENSLKNAVLRAVSLSVRGDYVILSPMCTSFDMFKDFEERGRVFKEEVKSLCGKHARKSF